MKLRIWGGGTHPGLCSWVLRATHERDRVLRQTTRRKCIWRQTGYKSRDANCYQKLSGGSRTRVSLMGPKKTRSSWHFDFNSNEFAFLYLFTWGQKRIYIYCPSHPVCSDLSLSQETDTYNSGPYLSSDIPNLFVLKEVIQHPYYQAMWPYNLNEKQTDNTTIDVGLRHLKAKRSWSPIGFCHP